MNGERSGKPALPLLKTSLILFSSLSFFAYGAGALFLERMRGEFERYGLGKTRVLVGLLQWAAAAGLIIGLDLPWLGQAAAGGLALMMVVAVAARVRIRDSALQMLPAAAYLALNTYLCLAGF